MTAPRKRSESSNASRNTPKHPCKRCGIERTVNPHRRDVTYCRDCIDVLQIATKAELMHPDTPDSRARRIANSERAHLREEFAKPIVRPDDG